MKKTFIQHTISVLLLGWFLASTSCSNEEATIDSNQIAGTWLMQLDNNSTSESYSETTITFEENGTYTTVTELMDQVTKVQVGYTWKATGLYRLENDTLYQSNSYYYSSGSDDYKTSLGDLELVQVEESETNIKVEIRQWRKTMIFHLNCPLLNGNCVSEVYYTRIR